MNTYTPDEPEMIEKPSTYPNEPLAGLHRRFDKLESNFSHVRNEQHAMALSLLAVDKRIDLVELQMNANQQREVLILDSFNKRMDDSSNMLKRLFDKFDLAAERAVEDRKKMMIWVITTALSVLSSIGIIMFNKVFGA
jgi:hypothetical protein